MPTSSIALASVASVPTASTTRSGPAPSVSSASTAGAASGSATATAPSSPASVRFHSERVMPTTFMPRIRKSCAMSCPVTPSPITAATCPGNGWTRFTAWTHVPNTWSNPAAGSEMESGTGTSLSIGTTASSVKTPSTSRPIRPPLMHKLVRPARQRWHHPQKTPGSISTRVPAGYGQAGGAETTSPTISWPMIRGCWTGILPARILTSVPQIPTWWIRTSMWPLPDGSGRSTTSRTPGPATRTALNGLSSPWQAW